MSANDGKRCWPVILIMLAAGCGGETPAARMPASLACQQGDGRCGACSWQDNGARRCRVTIFVATCPAGARQQPERSCPSQPVASCDRSTPRYLEGEPGFGDVDFYYDLPDVTLAEKECSMSRSTFPDVTPRWSVYR